MFDLQNIEENYKRMLIEELISLSQKPEELRVEVIPILQKELFNRGKHEEALSLSNFLVTSKRKSPLKNLSIFELRELIDERLTSGEPLESIKIDLKDNGINIFDIINEDEKLRNKAFDYITHLKKQGLEDHEIDEKLKETLSIEKEDSEMIKVQLKKKGKQNLVIGYSLVIIMSILSILLFKEGRTITIGGILLIGAGIWRIVVGYDQLKD